MRELDTATLDGAARDWAAQYLLPSVTSAEDQNRCVAGHGWVVQNFIAATFKDEFEYLLEEFRRYLGPAALAEFDAESDDLFTPRTDKVLKEMLADKLAIDMAGNHLKGKVGTTNLGSRVVGKRVSKLGNVKNEYWPIYAGEGEERIAGSKAVDKLPPGTEALPLGATNTRISNEIALLMCNVCVDQLDEGGGAAVISIRSGAQPTDPDSSTDGTQLALLTCAGTAFGAAADGAGSAIATAASITDDSSADATGTAGYFRASATTDGTTIADNHIDGECGTSGADMNLNTLAIVTGAVVSISAWTISVSET